MKKDGFHGLGRRRGRLEEKEVEGRMTRSEWLKQWKQVSDLWREDDHDGALSGLDRLLRKTRKAIKAGVTEWDVLELMALRAALLEESGKPRAAVKQYLARANFARGHLTSYGHALASSLEFAASGDARMGDRKTSVRVLEELLRLRSTFPDANAFLEETVRAAREVRDERSRTLGRKYAASVAKKRGTRSGR